MDVKWILKKFWFVGICAPDKLPPRGGQPKLVFGLQFVNDEKLLILDPSLGSRLATPVLTPFRNAKLYKCPTLQGILYYL